MEKHEANLQFLNEDLQDLPIISISKVIELISEPFDKEGVAQKTYNKHHNNPESQYYQKTVEEIIEMWEAKGAESCRYGSMLDDYIGLNLTQTEDDIELWKLDHDYEGDERLHGICDSFDNFLALASKSGDTKFVTREQTVYYKINEGYIKGRFDCLLYNERTNKWIVVDWKSSGSIDTSNRWAKLLGPCSHLDACNYNTYTLQLEFYKTALIYGGYLPEGTTEDDVELLLVQLPGKEISDGKNFATYKEAYKYDKTFIDKVLNFALKKNIILERRNTNESN